MDRKEQLLIEKEKIMAKIKKEQTKLKKIDEELKGISIQEKLKSMEKVNELLKEKGIQDMDEFLTLIRQGKVDINL